VRSGADPEALLRDLARSLLEAWPDDVHADREGVRAELERLLAWAASGPFSREGGSVASAEGEPETSPPTAPDADGVVDPEDTPPVEAGDSLLLRRVLEALRLECLRRWSEGGGTSPAAPACMDLLAALEERARLALPRDGRDFASRLADPDGFELLVEVAHDLRSPLTSVSFLAETLRGGFSGPINDQQRHQLGLVYSAALAMQSVVTDVMDLARHGADVLDEPTVAFSLSDVFEGVARLVRPIAEVKGIQLRTVPADPDRVRGRPLTLQRIILNLVTNGLKFTEHGYVELSAAWVARDQVEISVRDTGRGIDPESQRAMYQPFRKARDRPGSFFSGSGLGLSIVRRLVGALGSELELETRAGWGTRLHFRVRLAAVDHL
jgi:signal transduction histidine kinase